MADSDDILAELRGQYLHLTEVRLQRIEQLLRALAAPDQRLLTATLEELKREFHGLAGSGRTFGYARVTDLAREAEAECDALLSQGQSPGSEQLTRWRDKHAAIRAEISTDPKA